MYLLESKNKIGFSSYYFHLSLDSLKAPQSILGDSQVSQLLHNHFFFFFHTQQFTTISTKKILPKLFCLENWTKLNNIYTPHTKQQITKR